MARVPRSCDACGAAQPPRYGIPDPCLGTLPHVENACCGHGYRRQCYVVVIKRDGTGTYLLRGERARTKLTQLGGNPAPLTREGRGLGPMYGWS